MKNQIEQLVKIALEFKELGTKANLPQTHTVIQSPCCRIIKGETEVSLYFANNFDVFSLKWGSIHTKLVEVSLYSLQIHLPYDIVNEEYLQKAINELVLLLFNFRYWVDLNSKTADDLKKQEQIDFLKAKLNELENPNSKPLDDLDLPF